LGVCHFPNLEYDNKTKKNRLCVQITYLEREL